MFHNIGRNHWYFYLFLAWYCYFRTRRLYPSEKLVHETNMSLRIAEELCGVRDSLADDQQRLLLQGAINQIQHMSSVAQGFVNEQHRAAVSSFVLLNTQVLGL